jgi:hypothetical protein
MEGMSKPVPGDWGWSGPAKELSWDYNSDRAAHNYSLAYRKLRQLGVAHEDAVQGAQRQTYGQVRSQNPELESTRNRAWAFTQMSSPLPVLPAVRAAVEQAQEVQPQAGVNGRRMAVRWGLPLAGGVLGLYGLTALLQPRAEVEEEGYASTR